MKYLTNLLESGEIFCEKRVPSEQYVRLLSDTQRLMALCRTVMASGDLSQSEIILMYCALNYAVENDGENVTVAQAAKRLGAPMPSVSRTLKSLSQKGFIERYSDPDDRRTVRIKVTAAGESEIKRLLKHIFSVLCKAISGFSNEEISLMTELHEKFVAAMSLIVLSGKENG